MANSEEELKIENDKAQKLVETFLQEKIVVYSMPKAVKKFVSRERNPKNDKIILLILGVFAFFIIGGLSYFIVVKTSLFSMKQASNVIPQTEKPIVEAIENNQNNLSLSTTTESLTSTTTNNLAPNSGDVIGTSTVGTSSEEISTSTTGNEEPIFSEGSVLSSTEATSSQSGGIGEAKVVKEAVDTDADGLSDLEEILLGTDKTLMDTDNDGYSDFQEFNTLHNPVGKGEIASNTSIIKYQNKTYKYSLFYPLAWLVSNFDGDNSVIFRIDALQFVQITAQQNDNKQSLEDWYAGQFGVDLVNDSQKITTKTGWSVITSKDGLNWFLMKDGSNSIFVISYNMGITNVFNYKKIFEMMINSFEVGDSKI